MKESLNTEDREQLEWAAKAAGITGTWQDGPFFGIIGSAIGDMDVPWNPLRNDGQALRLAVKLGMIVSIINHPDLLQVEAMLVEVAEAERLMAVESLGTDHNAATRRAIVRAAAEIGKAMK